VSEPGLDVHEWESEWASLEDDIVDSPETGLAYVHELMTRMLKERRILDDSLAVLEGADPEWVKTWEAGVELARKLDDSAVEVERDEVLEQIANYRELFETLLADRAPP
jgi:hypothetical protein